MHMPRRDVSRVFHMAKDRGGGGLEMLRSVMHRPISRRKKGGEIGACPHLLFSHQFLNAVSIAKID
jgi:hypothetical protein